MTIETLLNSLVENGIVSSQEQEVLPEIDKVEDVKEEAPLTGPSVEPSDKSEIESDNKDEKESIPEKGTGTIFDNL